MVLNPTGFLLHGIYNSDKEYSILWPPLQRFYAELEGICFVVFLCFIFGKGKIDVWCYFSYMKKFINSKMFLNGNPWSKRINFNLQIYRCELLPFVIIKAYLSKIIYSFSTCY